MLAAIQSSTKLPQDLARCVVALSHPNAETHELLSRESQRNNIIFHLSMFSWFGLGIATLVCAACGGPIGISLAFLAGYVCCGAAIFHKYKLFC